jgi:hypothetical protein
LRRLIFADAKVTKQQASSAVIAVAFGVTAGQVVAAAVGWLTNAQWASAETLT